MGGTANGASAGGAAWGEGAWKATAGRKGCRLAGSPAKDQE